MRRREFITLIGGAAVWPLTARAQPAMPVIGLLASASADAFAGRMASFHRNLGESGFVEGRNVTVEYRWAVASTSRDEHEFLARFLEPARGTSQFGK